MYLSKNKIYKAIIIIKYKEKRGTWIYLFKGILSDVDNDKEDECDDDGDIPIRQRQPDINR